MYSPTRLVAVGSISWGCNMMDLIADRDGVDVIIAPVEKNDGFTANFDFNFGVIKVHEAMNKARNWDLRLYDGKSLVGRVKFSAYQFMADGIERRTISFNFIELERAYRGQGKSYDVTKFIITQVTRDCDRDWGKIDTKPVMFVEKKNFVDIPRDQHSNVFNFLKKLGEKILGVDNKSQNVPDHDLVATAIGDDLSIQLICEHLERSDKMDISKL